MQRCAAGSHVTLGPAGTRSFANRCDLESPGEFEAACRRLNDMVQDLSRIFGRRRLEVAIAAAFLLSLVALLRPASYPSALARAILVALVALAAFGVLEQWPRRLPKGVSRWVLQVIGVAVTIPVAMAIAYFLTTFGSPVPWYRDDLRMTGFKIQTVLGLLFVPWIALAALLQKIKDEARHQALAFKLERSQLEKEALAARLRLLHAQVEPHFLFNTLANVRELLVSNSPQASAVLDSLITYLRAAVPQLHSDSTMLADEFSLVRAYLEIMRMRMPDRLTFDMTLPAELVKMPCPPMCVLTLVENAVRHGIDPSVSGGRIHVSAMRDGEVAQIDVCDDGIGLSEDRNGVGTGLATLRERLRLTFGDSSTLVVSARMPRGVIARLRIPVTAGTR
jgi:sensor histidine kinase YesM